MIPNDVPRTKNGWPTIGASLFTAEQLRIEGEKWRPTAMQTVPSTVAYSEWHKYATELYSRGVIPRINVHLNLKTGLVEPEKMPLNFTEALADMESRMRKAEYYAS